MLEKSRSGWRYAKLRLALEINVFIRFNGGRWRSFIELRRKTTKITTSFNRFIGKVGGLRIRGKGRGRI